MLGMIDAAVSTLPVQAPRVLLFSNAAERIASGAQAGWALALQIAQTVRWTCMDHIHARQVGCVLRDRARCSPRVHVESALPGHASPFGR